MKKRSLLLLAGFSMVLTSCLGTGYKNVSEEKGDTSSVKVTETLRLTGDVEEGGKFVMSQSSVEKYADGHFGGVLGIGKITGDVKVVSTITYVGSWEASTESIYKLTITRKVHKLSVSGDGGEQYKADRLEAIYNLLYGEEKAALLLSGKTLTTKYEGEDVVTSYVTVDNENMTFAGSFLV